MTLHWKHKSISFNTASGKHCCNWKEVTRNAEAVAVSIPQAVSTVATEFELPENYLWKIFFVSIPQAVSTVATLDSSNGMLLLL